MADYVLTESAQADVEEIIAAIAKDDIKTAMRSFAIVYRASIPLVIVRVVRWRRTTRAFLADQI